MTCGEGDEKSSIENRASRAVGCLEHVWAWLRASDPRIPAAVLLVIDAAGRKRRLGHFAHSTWRYRDDQGAHEVGISPRLFESAEDVLAALLHEAAHAINHGLRIDDCGPDGYYHRKEYCETARSLGLECGFRNRRYGWTSTRFPPGGLPERYRPIVAYLRRSLPWGSQAQSQIAWVDRPRPTPGHLRLTCGCPGAGRTIFARPRIAEDGGVRCDLCSELFVPAQTAIPRG
jgi:hypothetical protein